MSETWKRWEGQSVNGEFPLLRYLGGSRHGAVFLTKGKAGMPELVAIKLIAAEPVSAVSQLHRWKKTQELSHPHLLRILESGQCELEDTPLLYVVLENAEEDLSQILPERALTPEEVRELLPAVLDALAYIHDQGVVHGRIRPSNILAIGNEVKVSTDTLRASGDLVASPDGWGGYDAPESSSRRLTSAADVWSLAVTLVQVLTQQRPLWHPNEPAAPTLPEHTPEPFREIASHCLRVDPQQRWTIPQIAAALQPKPFPALDARSKPVVSSGSVAGKKPRIWVYALGSILAVAVIMFIVLSWARSRGSSSGTEPVETTMEKPASSPSDQVSKAEKPADSGVAKGPTSPAGKGAVLERVMPRVSASSRRTIEGKIKVVVLVKANADGKVTEAKLVSPGPSQYFARLTLDAAREWKFAAPQVGGQVVPSEWRLQFGLRRSGTEVDAIQTAPR